MSYTYVPARTDTIVVTLERNKENNQPRLRCCTMQGTLIIPFDESTDRKAPKPTFFINTHCLIIRDHAECIFVGQVNNLYFSSTDEKNTSDHPLACYPLANNSTNTSQSMHHICLLDHSRVLESGTVLTHAHDCLCHDFSPINGATLIAIPPTQFPPTMEDLIAVNDILQKYIDAEPDHIWRDVIGCRKELIDKGFRDWA